MKRWQPVFLAFLVTLLLGGALGLMALLWLATRQPRPAPPVNRPPSVVPNSAVPGFTPIPWADTSVPTIPPTLAPVQTPALRLADLPAVGLVLEVPKDWDIQEETFETECGFLGGTLAKYILTSPAGDYMEIFVTCPPATTTRLGPCLRPVIIDETRRIYRSDLAAALITYSEYSYSKNEMQCPAWGWPVGSMYVTGGYYNRKTFVPDLETVDRIMLSVREK